MSAVFPLPRGPVTTSIWSLYCTRCRMRLTRWLSCGVRKNGSSPLLNGSSRSPKCWIQSVGIDVCTPQVSSVGW